MCRAHCIQPRRAHSELSFSSLRRRSALEATPPIIATFSTAKVYDKTLVVPACKSAAQRCKANVKVFHTKTAYLLRRPLPQSESLIWAEKGLYFFYKQLLRSFLRFKVALSATLNFKVFSATIRLIECVNSLFYKSIKEKTNWSADADTFFLTLQASCWPPYSNRINSERPYNFELLLSFIVGFFHLTCQIKTISKRVRSSTKKNWSTGQTKCKCVHANFISTDSSKAITAFFPLTVLQTKHVNSFF